MFVRTIAELPETVAPLTNPIIEPGDPTYTDHLNYRRSREHHVIFLSSPRNKDEICIDLRNFSQWAKSELTVASLGISICALAAWGWHYDIAVGAGSNNVNVDEIEDLEMDNSYVMLDVELLRWKSFGV